MRTLDVVVNNVRQEGGKGNTETKLEKIDNHQNVVSRNYAKVGTVCSFMLIGGHL